MCEYCEKANEEKAIEHLKKYPTNWIFPNVDKMAIDTVLELIEKQQAEIEKDTDTIDELIGQLTRQDGELEQLREYKKISELTKISCCTAQNCEALNNAIRNGLENNKLKEELEKKDKIINEMAEEIEERTGSCPFDTYEYEMDKCKDCQDTYKEC